MTRTYNPTPLHEIPRWHLAALTLCPLTLAIPEPIGLWWQSVALLAIAVATQSNDDIRDAWTGATR